MGWVFTCSDYFMFIFSVFGLHLSKEWVLEDYFFRERILI